MRRFAATVIALSLLFVALVMGCADNKYSGVEKSATWQIAETDAYSGSLVLNPDGTGYLEYSKFGDKATTKQQFKYQYISGTTYQILHDGRTDTLVMLDNGYARTTLLDGVAFIRR